MSSQIDLVHDALGETPMSRGDIAEATGLELQTISVILSTLRKDGRAQRTPEGWVHGDAHIHEPAVKTVAARETKVEKPEAKPAKREAKPRRAKAIPPPAAIVPHVNGRCCEFAIAESGAILFKITDGPRAGELGEIGCADALALFRLMGAVDFIRENE